MVWLMILLTVRENIIPRGGYPNVQGGCDYRAVLEGPD